MSIDWVKKPLQQARIGVVGLGYVGLPLALCFAKRFEVKGFDLSVERLTSLKSGVDSAHDLTEEELSRLNTIEFVSTIESLKLCNVYIVCVPTPVDDFKVPDLRALKSSARSIGGILKQGDIVIFESTVYPTVTEELLIPILEEASGKQVNKDFGVGYSPERINPGDRERTIESIVKVTSGSDCEVAKFVDELYSSVITAGTFPASSISTAEAAKVIENVQRDINIALTNELSQIFELLGLKTTEVLAAAGTKWNFHKYQPGLVGGHCIGVDPYYLTYKARQLGHNPQLILAGRAVNDSVAARIGSRLMKSISNVGVAPKEVLIAGITFKENCSDLRNSKAFDVMSSLLEFDALIDAFDPNVPRVQNGIQCRFFTNRSGDLVNRNYDGIIITVSHSEFVDLSRDFFLNLLKPGGVIFDVRNCFGNALDLSL